MIYDDAFKNKTLDLWHKALINPQKMQAAALNCAAILKNAAVYKKVEAATGIPWWWVGCIHGLEASFDMHSWLANGDSISKPTVHVPVGLHCDGTWQDAAIKSLQHQKYIGIKDWTLPHALYLAEAYNGFGTRKHGINSPYIWSGTNNYVKGKYVADGVWDPEAVSKQIGVGTMLKYFSHMSDTGVVLVE